MLLFQKVVHSLVRLSRCIYNLPVLSLCSLARTLLETHRTSLPASPLEPLHVAGTTSHAPPPPSTYMLPWFYFVQFGRVLSLFTLSVLLIERQPVNTKIPRDLQTYTHICPPGLTNLVLYLLIDLRLKKKKILCDSYEHLI